jgi:tRNA(Ile)-lysidine synthase
MLRGADADRDEAYSIELCERFNVPISTFKVDVSRVARENGQSFEMAGREVRYEHFEKIKQTLGFQKIAVAHHQNDQGETVLLRLIRGSGLEGLTGIRPIRDGYIIRPLFDCSRQQIEAYCESQGLMPMEDHTNADSTYNRNFIRNEIVPRIDTQFGGSVCRQLAKTAERLSEDADFIQLQLDVLWHQMVHCSLNRYTLNKKAFSEVHPALQKRLIRRLYQSLTGNLIDLEQSHVDQVRSLLEGAGRKTFCFRGVKFFAEHDWLVAELETTMVAELPCVIPTLVIEQVTATEMKACHANQLSIYVDQDSIQGTLKLRHRMPGDVFIPFGMSGRKKLKDFFIDEKVPLNERDNIWILCDDVKIVWVYGYRQSAETRVTKNTEQILRLSLSVVVTHN